ncbi:MAG: indole-3-glycerol phosphate synthase TrpC [Bacteroidales bacterium]|nr:indole-3-glycerol phosphate synthase TrpC [Bacteroidales bacterium]
MDILSRIIENKKSEVARSKSARPFEKLQQDIATDRRPLSMVKALRQPGSSGIIAEYKTRSPSLGVLNQRADVGTVTKQYVEAGAAALSVLTDYDFFGGSHGDLRKAREINGCPILQKDFFIDEYQVAEAYLNGADVILLIAAALDAGRLGVLAKAAKSYGMEVIMEVHNLKELEMLTADIDIIGVNNRDLTTFRTDIANSLALADHIPAGMMKISESGIDSAQKIMTLKEAGFSGFLIGETFMKKADPGEECRKLIEQLKKNKKRK